MEQVYDDLWQTKLEIPFGGVHAHAYFLTSTDGNILLYNSGHLDEIQQMADLGGLEYQLLSHRDETGSSLRSIKERFGSSLCCHIKEEPFVAEYCPVDVTFSERTTRLLGVEAVHTPGHTDGSTSFVYLSPNGRTYLFTGDSLFQSNGSWGTFVMPRAGGSKESLDASLRFYRTLRPDAVFWSASGGGTVTFVEPAEGEWIAAIDSAIEELRR